jgi:hypothetical protein
MNAINISLIVGVLSTLLISNTTHKGAISHTSECDHAIFSPSNDEITGYHSKQMAYDDEKHNGDTYQNVKEAENQFSEKDFDVALYNNYDASKNIYYDMACSGDNALTDRMLEQGKRPQQATDARAKFDKYSMLQYLSEELNSAANSRWWDNDALEHLF